MPDISNNHIYDLLRQAEERLQPHSSGSKDKSFSLKEPTGKTSIRRAQEDNLSVRKLQKNELAMASTEENSAGTDWFNLPKTDLTPEFKREWQLLRMRGVIDPKHQKKALRANAPEYSQVGQVIVGPTDFHSARLTRKEKKDTILKEMTGGLDGQKLLTKYASIQRNKSSGKKAFYKKLVSQRRKRQN
ncbi:dTDP-fucopyranose mutase [Conoideocrella luteorostrata]|uniref:dTDP-fucopyranose mutase n=1 Tax=Conoideocrella luteorostrata TaxID=1105319 RepID=A0AAJ0CY08_9HYPO|nr:dTDP-fucopyranose mutase [Conoideocrella luteorostrata]